jgi:hypothetical protein
VVFDSADLQNFVIPLPAPATTVALDPDSWILDTGVTKVAYIPGGPKIVETSPAPGETIEPAAAPRQIVVRFHTPVNAHAGDFSLKGQHVGSVPFTLSSLSNVDTITLTVDGRNLKPDIYTLTLQDAITAVDSGKSLDGEIPNSESAASLPSGDGLPGGDAVIRFQVRFDRDSTSGH